MNHDLFFSTLAPATVDASGGVAAREPSESSPLSAAIVRDFGSFAAFRAKFTALAMSVFGSGWVFLHVDASLSSAPATATVGEARLKLALAVTPNQDNPAILAQDPANVALMCLDVWEVSGKRHAPTARTHTRTHTHTYIHSGRGQCPSASGILTAALLSPCRSVLCLCLCASPCTLVQHAYYMDYTNKRADFVEAWWNIVGE